jgi:predicted CxxxxCH...CXXCH cytochrome family protein
MNRPSRQAFFAVFAVSGFSGLIYESIWTHYLKLFLGHAAYAAQSCESCHPCGAKATTGHPASWTDRTSLGFHAYSANAGLSNCQGCHGVALDGVGGSARTSCAQCHGATWRTNCVMCHGGTDNQTGAPPRTTWGNTGDAVRVGTHASHVAATHGLAAAVACATCHAQPADALAAGHVDGGTSEVIFSGRAIQGTTTAAWTRATATCSNTYCHGATLSGGTAKSPVWTTTTGTALACGACHGAPPPAPHSASTACGSCHSGYTATTVNAAIHINGVVEATGMTCTSCHGTASRAAYGSATTGEVTSSAAGQGAPGFRQPDITPRWPMLPAEAPINSSGPPAEEHRWTAHPTQTRRRLVSGSTRSTASSHGRGRTAPTG